MFSAICVMLVIFFSCFYVLCEVLSFAFPAFLGIVCFIAAIAGSIDNAALLFMMFLLSLIIVIVQAASKNNKMSDEEIKKRTKQNQRERKIEKEYGIIDFSEKK